MELIEKAFLLLELCCRFGIRSIYIVVNTCIELLKFAIYLHFSILWKIAIWIIAGLSLPFRALAALFRERSLEVQLGRLNSELENVIWEKKEIMGQLNMANKERVMVEAMLLELEDEHDEAIAKIELLEGEVRILREEIKKSKHAKCEALGDYKSPNEAGNVYGTKNEDDYRTSSLISRDKNNLIKETVLRGLANSKPKALKTNDILTKQREIALSRSFFSTILSVVVGIIVWKAEDPCMPLVVALFIVVFMSLMSVIQYFSSIEHQPASEAVALLSLNWFILGTLTYPSLPKIIHALAPLTVLLLGL